jgi:hypothetical protein
MVFGQETLFHCIPIPWVTTMVSSYVLKISHLSTYLVASHQVPYFFTYGTRYVPT